MSTAAMPCASTGVTPRVAAPARSAASGEVAAPVRLEATSREAAPARVSGGTRMEVVAPLETVVLHRDCYRRLGWRIEKAGTVNWQRCRGLRLTVVGPGIGMPFSAATRRCLQGLERIDRVYRDRRKVADWTALAMTATGSALLFWAVLAVVAGFGPASLGLTGLGFVLCSCSDRVARWAMRRWERRGYAGLDGLYDELDEALAAVAPAGGPGGIGGPAK